MKKIIITGATGMIGSSLAELAVNQGNEVFCIVRKNSGRISNICESKQLKILYADLSDYANFNISEKGDIFFHLAWNKTSIESRDDINIQIQNIQYTVDAVKLAQRMGCSVFIGAGSQAEYGTLTEKLHSNTPVNPESAYGISKYTAGKLSSLLCTSLHMRFNWLRILSVYGPHDARYTLISYIMEELQKGRSPELTKCEQTWDYLHCNDAAHAFLAVGDKGFDGKIYPLGSGEGRKLSEYVKIIRDSINPDIELKFGKKPYYTHQPMYLTADISELTQDTGWKPEIEFEDGIKRIIACT